MTRRRILNMLVVSPDMICQEHDLSIYAANFRESCSTLNDRRRPFIWEGHGLLSWIMESSDNSGDILIHGKAVSAKDSSSSSTDHAEAYIELQPVSALTPISKKRVPYGTNSRASDEIQ